jgi:hypothetical protein
MARLDNAVWVETRANGVWHTGPIVFYLWPTLIQPDMAEGNSPGITHV